MFTTRRQFLCGSIAASGLAAATTQLPAAEATSSQSRGEKLRISVLSYSFRGLLKEGQMDIFGYLESCKYRYGLDAADIWNGFLPNLEPAFLKKVRDALDERGLELADLAVDGAHVWEDNPDAREKNYTSARAHLEAARVLGARFVRFDAGGGGENWSEEAFDHIVKRYQEYAQYGHDHG